MIRRRNSSSLAGFGKRRRSPRLGIGGAFRPDRARRLRNLLVRRVTVSGGAWTVTAWERGTVCLRRYDLLWASTASRC